MSRRILAVAVATALLTGCTPTSSDPPTDTTPTGTVASPAADAPANTVGPGATWTGQLHPLTPAAEIEIDQLAEIAALIAGQRDPVSGEPLARDGDTVRVYGFDSASRSLDVAIGRLDGESSVMTGYGIREGQIVGNDVLASDDPDLNYRGVAADLYPDGANTRYRWERGRLSPSAQTTRS